LIAGIVALVLLCCCGTSILYCFCSGLFCFARKTEAGGALVGATVGGVAKTVGAAGKGASKGYTSASGGGRREAWDDRPRDYPPPPTAPQKAQTYNAQTSYAAAPSQSNYGASKSYSYSEGSSANPSSSSNGPAPLPSNYKKPMKFMEEPASIPSSGPAYAAAAPYGGVGYGQPIQSYPVQQLVVAPQPIAPVIAAPMPVQPSYQPDPYGYAPAQPQPMYSTPATTYGTTPHDPYEQAPTSQAVPGYPPAPLKAEVHYEPDDRKYQDEKRRYGDDDWRENKRDTWDDSDYRDDPSRDDKKSPVEKDGRDDHPLDDAAPKYTSDVPKYSDRRREPLDEAPKYSDAPKYSSARSTEPPISKDAGSSTPTNAIANEKNEFIPGDLTRKATVMSTLNEDELPMATESTLHKHNNDAGFGRSGDSDRNRSRNDDRRREDRSRDRDDGDRRYNERRSNDDYDRRDDRQRSRDSRRDPDRQGSRDDYERRDRREQGSRDDYDRRDRSRDDYEGRDRDRDRSRSKDDRRDRSQGKERTYTTDGYGYTRDYSRPPPTQQQSSGYGYNSQPGTPQTPYTPTASYAVPPTSYNNVQAAQPSYGAYSSPAPVYAQQHPYVQTPQQQYVATPQQHYVATPQQMYSTAPAPVAYGSPYVQAQAPVPVAGAAYVAYAPAAPANAYPRQAGYPSQQGYYSQGY
ncbi:hypothetical protein BJ742DRAFT_817741, partial [Cladochytrium replicatum]